MDSRLQKLAKFFGATPANTGKSGYAKNQAQVAQIATDIDTIQKKKKPILNQVNQLK